MVGVVVYHRRLIGAQLPEVVAQIRLDGRRHTWIAHREQGTSGRTACEPIAGDERLQRGHNVRLQIGSAVLGGNRAQRLHGLVADDRLLDVGETFEWWNQKHGVRRTADQI